MRALTSVWVVVAVSLPLIEYKSQNRLVFWSLRSGMWSGSEVVARMVAEICLELWTDGFQVPTADPVYIGQVAEPVRDHLHDFGGARPEVPAADRPTAQPPSDASTSRARSPEAM